MFAISVLYVLCGKADGIGREALQDEESVPLNYLSFLHVQYKSSDEKKMVVGKLTE